MSTINDGGQAFPVPGLSPLPNNEFIYPMTGMTLRDYFAAKALQGLCANPGGPFQASSREGWAYANCSENDVALVAYQLADAMLRVKATGAA